MKIPDNPKINVKITVISKAQKALNYEISSIPRKSATF
tara:strand:+ start:479 stop:592 length:114 start_codon:yes stop_codon:yes gene_type:complete